MCWSELQIVRDRISPSELEERSSAFAVNVKGRNQEPQDKGRDQETVCPTDKNATGARCITESDDGSAKQ
jgi:hypothetical protein